MLDDFSVIYPRGLSLVFCACGGGGDYKYALLDASSAALVGGARGGSGTGEGSLIIGAVSKGPLFGGAVYTRTLSRRPQGHRMEHRRAFYKRVDF